ncbi:molecular chaperone DnaJ [Chloroflexia bacterium SDU3-3]|nr:molecular chaperone DnaJ [Chloroflexia bacterium SDU3-3]
MNTPLENLWEQIRHATSADAVFGPIGAGDMAALKRRYRELAQIAHPDHNPRQQALAQQVFQSLSQWYQLAQAELADGRYGAPPRLHVAGRLHHYVGTGEPWSGDLCHLFPADADGTPVLLKMAGDPHNRDLLLAEAEALDTLDAALAGRPVRAHFPTLIEQLLVEDEHGVMRQTNVLRRERSVASLAEVRRAYPRGVHPADAAWMFNRMLAALALAHDHGLVHGAVLPEHVLVRPDDHNGILIDWCYSVGMGQPIRAISPANYGMYPPEVLAKEPATAATDIYLAARTMVVLLGGNGVQLPKSVPAPIRNLLQSCLIPSPIRRANDAWQLLEDFREVLDDCYGPPTFRPFRMPISAFV